MGGQAAPPIRAYLDIQGVRLYSEWVDTEIALADIVERLDPYPVGAQRYDPKSRKWREL